MSENLKEEEKYLHKVFHSNGYDNATIRAGSKELHSCQLSRKLRDSPGFIT